MILSKTFEGSKGEKLQIEFDYNSSNYISNLDIVVCDKGKSFDLTNLFESNEELWAIADTIIDNIIKSQ